MPSGAWSAPSRYAAVLIAARRAIFVFFSLTQENFFTRPNLENLLTSVSILLVVSIGMTFVVLTAGHRPLGRVAARADGHPPLPPASTTSGLPAWLAVLRHSRRRGVRRRAVNGVLIGQRRALVLRGDARHAVLYQGVVNLWSGTETTYITSSLIDWFGFGEVTRDPGADLDHGRDVRGRVLVLRWTYFGRDVYAVGGNIEAARLSGINVAER